MASRYERHAELNDVLDRARKLSVRTMIVDVEPLVSRWDNGQESLDQGVAMVVGKVAALPMVRVLIFATNSARRPSAIPAGRDIEVSYLAFAGKPLRLAPYRGLPRPGAVVGDQVPTDGLLARRLGFTFLHYQPPLDDVPPGPRLMYRLGQLALPLLFSRPRAGEPSAYGMGDEVSGFVSTRSIASPRASVIFAAAASMRGAPTIGATATRTS